MTKHVLYVILLLATSLLMSGTTLAQESEVLVDGLLNPRNFSFDADGNLYVAEAGLAGEQITADGEPFGATSQITMVSPDGSKQVLVRGLISFRDFNSLGAHDVEVTDESIWVLLGESSDFSMPFTHALVELDRETHRVKTWVDLLALELDEDPDGNPNLQSNPMDLEILDDGSVLIANAGCNCLMSWSADAGLSVAVAWEFSSDNPVPTTVQAGPDGDIYVGFLTGFPWDRNTARIERWSNGELKYTYKGLTAITGLLVTDDGTIYATEFGNFVDDWSPGRVMLVTEEGNTPVLEGLIQPYGLAQAPDGTIAVVVGSTGLEAAGMIVTVPMP